MTQCKHATPSGTFNLCALGRYGGRPSDGICNQCPAYEGPSRGLGDTIDKITSATGIKAVVDTLTSGGCGCQKRRVSLNQILPYSQ